MTQLLNSSPATITIYDPYYCNGGTVDKLNCLNFPNVINIKQDCYAAWESNRVPEHHIFLTNPPYSNDHIDKLMQFLTSPSQISKPWLLLMPQYVAKKDYYEAALKRSNLRPFYIVPKKRYVYEPPKDFRGSKKSDTHKKSSPFVSMWFCWGGSQQNTDVLASFFTKTNGTNCELARSKSALRDLRRKGK